MLSIRNGARTEYISAPASADANGRYETMLKKQVLRDYMHTRVRAKNRKGSNARRRGDCGRGAHLVTWPLQTGRDEIVSIILGDVEFDETTDIADLENNKYHYNKTTRTITFFTQTESFVATTSSVQTHIITTANTGVVSLSHSDSGADFDDDPQETAVGRDSRRELACRRNDFDVLDGHGGGHYDIHDECRRRGREFFGTSHVRIQRTSNIVFSQRPKRRGTRCDI